jgi:ubiquinone/menaquinone biosynthesis C-methylase UbiE
MIDAVAASLPTRGPRCILDVGCGTGRLLRAAADRWPQAGLIGVDPAARMVERARRLLPGAALEVAPAEALPLPDATVDLVLSCVSFHHWSDQPKGLAEAGRVLRSSGRLCLADIVLPRWVARLFRSRARSAAALEHLLEAAGFQIGAQERRFARVIAITSARKALGG